FPGPVPESELGNGISDLSLEYIIEGCSLGREELKPWRVGAWLALIDRGAAGSDNPRSLHIMRPEWPWSAEEVLAVESQHAAAVPPKVVAAALVEAPSGPALTALIDEITRTAATRPNGGALA